jgi:hypothetical protein
MTWIAPTDKETDKAAFEICLLDATSARASEQDYIQNLRWTRDLLLPRLLSGQVELKTEPA